MAIFYNLKDGFKMFLFLKEFLRFESIRAENTVKT